MNNAFQVLARQRQDFIILGLTGRTGSGCTTSAKIMGNGPSIVYPEPSDLPKESGYELSEVSKKRYTVAKKYAESYFPKFLNIKVSDLITAILLQESKNSLANHIKSIEGSLPVAQSVLDESKFALTQRKLNTNKKVIDFWLFGKGEVPKLTSKRITSVLERCSIFSQDFKKELDNKINDGVYTKLYQEAGNSIRRYKKPIHNPDDTIDVANLLYIPEVIDRIIQTLRKANKLERKPTYISIDAFRNPYEIRYFKDRYSAFYLVSVNANNSDRKKYLAKVAKLSSTSISELDRRESGKVSTDSEGDKCEGCGHKRVSSGDKLEKLFLQNVPACLELSDIHLYNPKKEPENHNALKAQLAWYVSLMLHPGLITPTSIERVMQLAYSAKVNSGCISRQVGAAITDVNYSIKGIGWNDVPTGQVPCNLRSLPELKDSFNAKVYSEYERNDDDFRNKADEHLQSFQNSNQDNLIGMNLSYCFKTIQNQVEGEKNQVHTRSLHAEENAFLQLSKTGGTGIEGGKLFTTASPCELCAKKAYQLGIKEIIYIDPYPGIAKDHIIANGTNPPRIIQFIGAVGDAYHKLYTPLMPMKDELELLKG
ncbi:putative deoxycytidylate deaminase [Vibrio crassostreae]|uniref:anti-phage dCTP deaminase n=1 Tax=Vibrio crassostreae TaxID=246167 RepID=UPI0005E6AC0E|nr:anti-phage dCTP deaminase [Vibrio crassostreae]TCT62903.1 dCMP deaminase [Vibrio crassostreae]TCT83895.1 dCMP deaminase [Vibrio crassostreae]TCU02129.1 dCMP deaminase [Vibrio crassostreae]TDW10020.1 dCMP deaminase [Vibrio crassostreae]CAK1804322.1 putative deoxycytidylate deaminase [Vibrio crassostreae]